MLKLNSGVTINWIFQIMAVITKHDIYAASSLVWVIPSIITKRDVFDDVALDKHEWKSSEIDFVAPRLVFNTIVGFAEPDIMPFLRSGVNDHVRTDVVKSPMMFS